MVAGEIHLGARPCPDETWLTPEPVPFVSAQVLGMNMGDEDAWSAAYHMPAQLAE